MIPEFEVTILGNTSSIPVHGRNHTSQVIRYGQELLLLDCGEGTQIQIRKYKVKSSRITHVFISHLHGDHYLGLVGLLSSYNLAKRTKPLTIFGPQGLDEIITTNFRWSNTKIGYPLTFVKTDPEAFNLLLNLPGIDVFSFPMKHRLPTTGFLIKEKPGYRSLVKEKLKATPIPLEAIQSLRKGENYRDSSGKTYSLEEYTHPIPAMRSYAFCSDTIFDPGLAQFIKGVDLLYHESTFMDSDEKRAADTFHSTGSQAGQIANLCGVKKLLLGHFSSRYIHLEPMLAEAQVFFPDTILSEEGQSYAL